MLSAMRESARLSNKAFLTKIYENSTAANAEDLILNSILILLKVKEMNRMKII